MLNNNEDDDDDDNNTPLHVTVSGENTCDKKINRDDSLHYNRNTAQVERKIKCDTSNNGGNWNHLKIIQKIPEQRTTGKARNRGTTENSHITHCTHTSESTNVKV
jgi:hypothetical protein